MMYAALIMFYKGFNRKAADMTTNSRRMPSVQTAMTPFPYSVAPHEDTRTALALMQEHGIRHLPVVSEGQIVGLLSERDVLTMYRLCAQTPKPVGEVCSKPAYIVDHRERLDNVVLGMAERGIGSAVVEKQGHLAGILTHSDVCRALARTLREIFSPQDPTDAA